MTTYRYKGQTKDGTAVSGVIQAYDEFEAASRLRNKDYYRYSFEHKPAWQTI